MAEQPGRVDPFADLNTPKETETPSDTNLDSLSLDEFTTKPAGAKKTGQTKGDLEKVADLAGFPSREPNAKNRKKTHVRKVYRTGRNQQLNIRVRQEDHDAFYDLVDRLSVDEPVPNGKVFQLAVQLLNELARSLGPIPEEELYEALTARLNLVLDTNK